MTDTVNVPNQPQVGSPQGDGEPSVPVWIDAGVQADGSPKTKQQVTPTSETGDPDAKLISQKPQVYQPTGDGKSKKIINFISMGLLVLILSSLTFGSLFFLDQKTNNQPEQQKASYLSSPPAQHIVEEPPLLPEEPIFTKKGDFALSVNGQILNWEEYEDFLNYQLFQMQTDVNDSQKREELNKSLIERLLISNYARSNGVTLNSQELEQAEIDYFGGRVGENFKSYPQTQKIIETQAYKRKLIENEVTWLSGGYFIIEKAGSQIFKQSSQDKTDSEKYAKNIIDLYQAKAKSGQTMDEVVVMINSDPKLLEIKELWIANYFIKLEMDKLQNQWPDDVNFYQKLSILKSGETSDVFVVKKANDVQKTILVDYGYAFAKIDKIQKNNFTSFNDWLNNSIQQASIISNL